MENQYERDILIRINSMNEVEATISSIKGKINKFIPMDKLIQILTAAEQGYTDKKSTLLYGGPLPKNTVYVNAYDNTTTYFILREESKFPITFYEKEYLVPIPNLIFKFNCMGNKVVSGGVAALESSNITMDTMLYAYPFTNASPSHLCWGNNKIPSLANNLDILSTLPDYFIGLPSSLHGFSVKNNTLNLEFRPLLEVLEGQEEYHKDLLTPLKTSFSAWVSKQ